MYSVASQDDSRVCRWEQCWLREEQGPDNTPQSPFLAFPPPLSTLRAGPEQVGLWEVGDLQERGPT